LLESYRVGDAVEVSVMSAVLPKGDDRTADTESFVMINIDGRHQVQQTPRVKGFEPGFDSEFTCHLAKESHYLEVTLYTSEAGQPGELLGTAQVLVHKQDYAPGSEVVAELLGEDHKATGAVVRLFVCRTNLQKTHRTLRNEATNRERPDEIKADLEAVKSELQVAREYIARLEPEMHTLKEHEEQERSRWEDENARLNHALDEASKTIAALQGELKHLQGTLDKAITDKDTTNFQLLEGLQEVKVAQSKQQALQAEKDEDDRLLVTAKSDIERLTMELEKERASNTEHTASLAAAAQECQDLKKLLKELEDAKGALKEEVQILQGDTEDLRKQLKAMEEALTNLGKESDANKHMLEDQVAAVEKEAKIAKEEQDRLAKINKDLQEEIAALKKEKASLESALEKATKDAAARESELKSDLERAKGDFTQEQRKEDEIRGMLKQAEKEVKSLKESHTEALKGKDAEIQTLRDKIVASETALEKEVAAGKKAADDIAALQKEMEGHKKQMEELQKQVEELQKRVEAEGKAKSEAEKKCDERDKRIKELELDDTLKQQLSAAIKARDEGAKAKEQAEALAVDLNTQLVELEKNLEALKKEKGALEEEKAALSTEVETMKKANGALQGEKEAMVNELEALKKELEALKKEVEALKKQKQGTAASAAKEKPRDLPPPPGMTAKDKEDLESEIRQLKKEVETMNKANGALQGEKEAMAKELESEIQLLKEQLRDAEAKQVRGFI